MAILSLTIYGIPTASSSGTEDITLTLGDEKKEGTFKKKMTAGSSTETVEVTLSPNHFNYQQKLYQPDEFNVEIQLSATSSSSNSKVSFSKDDILDMFEDKKVSLTTYNSSDKDSFTVGKDFYVCEVTCKKSPDATYANLKICSPDKLMTKKQNSQMWTAKKLYSDILTGDDGELQNYTLPYDSNSHVEVDTSNWKHLYSNSQEHIFPYLVQYNESFYDLLARTTNRWGEFMYYYDGKLHIGYDDDESKAKEIDNYNTITYLDYTETTATGKDYVTQAPDDDDVLNSHVTKDSYAIMMGTINTAFSSGGEMYWFMKVGQLLTTRHSLLNFLVDTIVMDVVIWLQMKIKNKQKNDKFNKLYFDKKEKKYVSLLDEQYDDSEETLNQFSEYEPIVDAQEYAKILVGEVVAGDNTIEIDYDTYAPGLHIGQLIKLDGNYYIVSEITSKEKEEVSLSVNKSTYEVEKTTTTSQVFTVKALAKVDYTDSDDSSISLKGYYPAIIPSGHVRKAEPQQAMVVGADDPQCNGRVRVMYYWQLADLLKSKKYNSIDQIKQSDLEDYDITNATPWIPFLQPTGNSMAGINGRHYLTDHVMVSYTHGNVERPYVSGGIPKSVHPFLRDGGSCFIGSPNGEYIRVHEGENQGATAFIANLSPGLSLISGFIDYKDVFGKDNEVSQCFDGGIMMGDKYGIWGIDCSTTRRSIQIKSPWGDIMMNAFTGITLTAPNGDIRIAGKNVSIMAGNNLTLTSGTNIRNKFVTLAKDADGKINWSTIGKDIVKAIINRLVELGAQICDLSIVRSFVEVFYKPEEGCLSIASGRYLKLQAGGARAGYPSEAYKDPKKALENLSKKDEKKSKKLFAKLSVDTMSRLIGTVPLVVDKLVADYIANYKECIRKRAEFETAYTNLQNLSNDNAGFCKSYSDLKDTLWNPKTKEIKTDDFSFDDDKVGDAEDAAVSDALKNQIIGGGPNDPDAQYEAMKTVRTRRKTAKEDLVNKAEALRVSIENLRKKPSTKELIKNYNAGTNNVNLKVDKDYIEDFRGAFADTHLGESKFFTYAYNDNNAITDNRATNLPQDVNINVGEFLNLDDFHATAMKRQVILYLLETWGMEATKINRKIEGNAVVDAADAATPAKPTNTEDLENNNKYQLYVESLKLSNFKGESDWSSWRSSLGDTFSIMSACSLKSIGENHAWGNPRAGEIIFGTGPAYSLKKNGQISKMDSLYDMGKFNTSQFSDEEKTGYNNFNNRLIDKAMTAGGL
ncbi:MAG: hypothetical protein IJT55_02925 [Prevotella sp.]|nr:hypothetical protein [Prevotella sp.]